LTPLEGIPPLYTLPPIKHNIKYSYKVSAKKKLSSNFSYLSSSLSLFYICLISSLAAFSTHLFMVTAHRTSDDNTIDRQSLSSRYHRPPPSSSSITGVSLPHLSFSHASVFLSRRRSMVRTTTTSCSIYLTSVNTTSVVHPCANLEKSSAIGSLHRPTIIKQQI